MVKLMLLLMSGLMNKRTKAEEVLFFHQDQEDSDRNKCTLFVERDLYSALLCTCPAPMRERSRSVSLVFVFVFVFVFVLVFAYHLYLSCTDERKIKQRIGDAEST